MNPKAMQRCVAFVFVLAVAFGQSAPVRAWSTACNAAIPATMVDTVTSSTAYPGMRFRFRITISANLNGHLAPAGAIGYGFVREVTAASNRDRNGSLILAPREIVYGKQHIPVIADPRDTALWAPATTAADRASGYLPIPGIIRTAVNQVRNGKNVTIGPGFHFHVIALGDPRNSAPCRKVGN
jgi:hypothetical protein